MADLQHHLTIRPERTGDSDTALTFHFDAITVPAASTDLSCRLTIVASTSKRYVGTMMDANGGTIGYLTTNSKNYETWTYSLSADRMSIFADGVSRAPGFRAQIRDTTLHSAELDIWYEKKYAITVVQQTGGSASADKYAAIEGEKVTLSATAAMGYQFTGWTVSPSVSVVGGRITMPASDITVTPVFTKITYTITKTTVPAGAGVITGPNTANIGDEVTLSQEPASGYAFTEWTLSDGREVVNNKFTMQAADITVTANYMQRSTATISTKKLSPETAVTITVNSGDPSFTHKYKIDFGDGIDTGWNSISGSATTTFHFETDMPDSTELSGGTFSLQTYSGTTLLGTYEISGLTYEIPAGWEPEIPDGITLSILRTVDGNTYANIGDYYVQRHCGVQAVISGCTAAAGATVESVRVYLVGYSGPEYDKTYSVTGPTYQSGLLTNSGTNELRVEVTDSRGLSKTYTKTFEVTPYTAPSITGFEVMRVDSSGDPDDAGAYAMHSFTYTWTQIGTNAVHTDLTSQGVTETDGNTSGWLMAATHQTFDILHVYDVELTVRDAFEATTVTVMLESGKFMMHFSADGSSVAIGHVVSETPHTGFTGTFEVDGDLDFYYGSLTLKEYIQGVINGTI